VPDSASCDENHRQYDDQLAQETQFLSVSHGCGELGRLLAERPS
jgi:hypothetical protein